jgi:hypothetical protein
LDANDGVAGMTEQEMEIAYLRLEMINTKTRNSFLLETIKNLTEERERLIKECEQYIEELMVLRRNYGIFPKKVTE